MPATVPDLDLARLMFGQHAVHVPAWLYVQHQGDGVVTFVGSSRSTEPHPLRYGSGRTHQLILGEIVVRPHWAIGTDAERGNGLGALITSSSGVGELLERGEVILDPLGRLARQIGA